MTKTLRYRVRYWLLHHVLETLQKVIDQKAEPEEFWKGLNIIFAEKN